MEANIQATTQTALLSRTGVVVAERTNPAQEQIAYAKLLDASMKYGLVLVIATFLVYLFATVMPMSFLSSHVAVNDLPKYWTMPVHDYLQQANMKSGWSWLGMINKADILNFVGIAFLSGITLICYARIIPITWRQRDYIFTVIASLEVLVLTLAASGILKAAGH